MTGTQKAMVGLGAVQLVSGYYSGMSSKIAYKMKAADKRFQAGLAISAAKSNSMKMTESYNDMAAMNAVMQGISGRSASSGSASVINQASEDNLNWDIHYSNLTGKMGQIAQLSEANALEHGGEAARYGGIQTGILSAARTLISAAQIK